MSEIEFDAPAEAAEDATTDIAVDRLDWPREAELVRFYPRPGEARQGRMVLPAFVMSLDKATGLATILTFYDADDARMIIRIPERSKDSPRGWERIDSGENKVAEEFFSILKGHNNAILDLRQRVEALTEKVASLTATISAQVAAKPARVAAKKGAKRAT